MSAVAASEAGRSRSLPRALFAYLGASAACVLLLVWVMRLWHADLAVPFHTRGDALLFQIWIKGMIDNGWYLHNAYLGAPAGVDLHDFNQFDTLHFAILKCLSYIRADQAFVLNVYLLLTFPLTVLSSLFVLRRLKVGVGPAVVVSLLYAFLPYHFQRSGGHPFLAAYFHIPLIILVILWNYLDQEFLFRHTPNGYRLNLLNARAQGTLAIGALVACAGVYYAFFACYLLVVAGGAASLRWRRWQPLAAAALTIAVICGVGLLNAAPSLLYQWQHGANHTFHRDAAEAEVYGLKLAQLLLPVDDHRLPVLAHLKWRYFTQGTPLNNENCYAALGLIGAAGFLILLARLFGPLLRDHHWPRLGDDRQEALANGLTLLNGAAFFLATIGGLGSLIALLLSPWIRGYNRISIYMAFFALAAFALVLDVLGRKCRSPRSRWLYASLLVGLVVLGILDQAPPRQVVPNYAQARADYGQDREFAQKLEAALPEDAAVFQLPFMPFPEMPPIEGMLTYDPGRPYLHTHRLHWSYGTMRGRPGDDWARALVARPPEEMLPLLAHAGFQGIYLDRAGYKDQGAQLEKQLRSRLQAAPLVSAGGRFAFYDLTGFVASLRRRYTPEQWEAQRQTALSLPPALQVATHSHP